jgi:hypothetical protein
MLITLMMTFCVLPQETWIQAVVPLSIGLVSVVILAQLLVECVAIVREKIKQNGKWNIQEIVFICFAQTMTAKNAYLTAIVIGLIITGVSSDPSWKCHRS